MSDPPNRHGACSCAAVRFTTTCASERDALGAGDVAIVRMEQLAPFPRAELDAALANCTGGTPVFWVQEEPENMGVWPYLRLLLGSQVSGRFPLSGVCREASASPATGSASSHRLEQEELLTRAFQRD